MQGYGLLWRLLHHANLDHPWTAATDRYEMTMAGVNHLTFTLGITDRTPGTDVQPQLLRDVRDGHIELPSPLTRRLFLDTGCLPTNGDGHMQGVPPATAWVAATDDHRRPTTADPPQIGSRRVLSVLPFSSSSSVPFCGTLSGFFSFHSLN
jgi:hypothetical protein